MRTFPLGASAELPVGPTPRVRGVPKLGGGDMCTFSLGTSAELPMGPRNKSGVCRTGAAVPCELSHWGL
eukprot:8917556-Pyramimonas_sp.AAC.1